MMRILKIFGPFLLVILSLPIFASDTLSYSGRLVNSNGSPVVGPVRLIFDLAYTSTPPTLRCTREIPNVDLTHGVFHVNLDFDCTAAGMSLENVLTQVPVGQSVAIRVTNADAGKVYSYQVIQSIPLSKMAHTSKQLIQMGANNNEVLTWTGSKWEPKPVSGATGGTVTSITAGSGLSGGTIVSSGTIAIANSGVTDTHLAGNIARSKLANGTPNYVLINDGTGAVSGLAQLSIALGGTGATTAADARTNLGLGTAATASIGYAAGNVLPGDNIPVCMPAFKLTFTGVGPAYWSCAADNDSLDGTKLPLAGGTMTGAINMNGNLINNLATPSGDADAATKLYVDNKFNGVSSSQWTTAGSDIYYATGSVGVGLSSLAPDMKVQIESRPIDKSDRGLNVEVRQHTATDGNYSNLGGVFKAQSTIASGVTNAGALTASWHVALRNNLVGTPDNGTLAMMKGNYVQYGHYNSEASAPLTTEVHGLHLAPYYKTGTIQTMYDIYAHQGSAGGTVTNHFGLYIAGNQKKNYIEGNTGFGISAPTEKLHVVGNEILEGKLRLKSNNTNFVELKAPDALASTILFNLPGTAGTGGQALITDGAGNLSWATISAGATAVGGDLTGTVSSATISNGAVNSTKIADGSIVDADIAAGAAIDQSKINGLAASFTAKENSITAGTSAQYWRGDKTWQTLNTSVVPEGTNLYFLESRVRAALMSGYAAGSALPLNTTDTLLQALGKLEGQIIANKASFDNSGIWSKNGANIYFNTGNVASGTNAPTGKFHAEINETGAGFVLTDSAAPNGFLHLTEGGGTANTFNPLIQGRPVGSGRFMSIYSDLVSGEDTGTAPLMVIAGRHNGGAVTTRPIVDFRNNTTSLMTVLPNGAVGIGTSTPTEKLEVSGGSIKTDGDVLSDSLFLADTTVATFSIGDYMDVVEAHPYAGGASAVWEVHAAATRTNWTEGHTYLVATTHNQPNEWREATQISENMYSSSAATKCFTVDVNGNTNAPRFRIRAIKNIASCGTVGSMVINFKIRSIGDNQYWSSLGSMGNDTTVTKFQPTGNSFNILTAQPNIGSTVPSTFTVASNGFVGIGTQSPTNKLTVSVPSGSSVVAIERPNGGFGLMKFSTGTARRWEMGVNSTLESGSNAGSDFGLWRYADDGSQNFAMLVRRSDGFIGVGGITPYTQMHVNGNIAATGWVGAGCETGCSTDAYAINYADGRIVTWDGAGAVCTKTGASATFTCSSDKRLKKDINPLTGGLDIILALQPKTYYWKNDKATEINYGFIAQEVQKVIPHAVSEQERPEGKFLSLDQGAFTPYMVNAIKDLNAKIEKKSSADRKIASLEEENKKIKEENKAMKNFLCKKFKDADFCGK